MGKFCTKCGRQLQEGEVCGCQQINQQPVQLQKNQQEQPRQVQPQVNRQEQPQQVQPQMNQQMQTQPVQPQMNQQVYKQPSVAGEYFGKLFQTFTNLIVKPVATGKKMVAEADVRISIALILLQGILSAIFAVAVCGKYAGYIKAASGIMDSYGAAFSEMLNMPYARIFIITLLASVAFSFLLAALLLCVHIFVKSSVPYTKMMSVVAVRSALLVPSIAAALIIFQFSAMAGLFLYVVLGVWGLIAMTMVMEGTCAPEKKDLFALFLSLAVLVFLIVCVFIMSKLWTYYLPDMIRTALDAVSGMVGSPSDLLPEILEEMF